MYVKVKVAKVDNFPDRKHLLDAGADVYLTEDAYLGGHETRVLGLGFTVEIPNGYVGFIFPRSKMSSKGIVTQLAPIDSGYTGEVFAIVTNTDSDGYQLDKNIAIGQLVILPVAVATFVSSMGADRGDKALGSTDNANVV